MFRDFANLWVPIGLAREVRANRLSPHVVAGERIVVFRDDQGRLAALIDRCPHRGVALSLGKLRDGIVECPFHGWRFDGSGAICAIPWNPDARTAVPGATAVPVREAGGLVWVHTGFDPRIEPEPSATMLRDDVAVSAQSLLWNAHWTRVMENMLDSPHLPFVHRRSIGRDLARFVAGRRMDVRWHDEPYGARILAQVEGRPRPTRLDYRFPNMMELFIDPPRRVFRLMAVCTPEAEGRTRLTLYTFRSFLRAAPFDALFGHFNRRIALEDQKIVESSDPAEVPPAAAERSVRTDQPTLAFRKLYFERIKGSSADPAPRKLR